MGAGYVPDLHRLADVVDQVRGVELPQLAADDLVFAVCGRQHALGHRDLRASADAGVFQHRAGGCIEHALGHSHLARDADAPNLVLAALPREHVVWELAGFERVHHRLDGLAVDHRHHGRHGLKLQVRLADFVQANAHGDQRFWLYVAVVVPDLEHLAVQHRFAGLIPVSVTVTGAMLRAGSQSCGNGVCVIAVQARKLLELPSRQVVAFADIAAVVQVLAASRVREQIARINALAGGLDLFLDLQDSDTIGHRPGLLPACNGERALEHASAQPACILDDAA